MSSGKPEYPPLFPPGFHSMSLTDVRMKCVVAFTLSSTREAIMDGLETVVDRLRKDAVECELWLDGSFTTEKIDPADVDLVMVLTSDFVNTATLAQADAIQWVESNLKSSHHCDSYVLVTYPDGHALAGYSQWMHAYWIKQFGFSRGLEFKGMPRVKVP